MKKCLLFFLVSSSICLANRTIHWITQGDLAAERELFIKSFAQAYKDFTEQDLEISCTKDEFLENSFKDDREALKNGEDVYVVSIKEGDKVVGFASFDGINDVGEVYIRLLAVDPDYWYQGIGKQLVFAINQKISGIKKYVLVTRRINEMARKFYFKLGFKESDYIHEGLDPKKYVGYELEF